MWDAGHVFPVAFKEPIFCEWWELRGGQTPAQVDQGSFTEEVAFELHLGKILLKGKLLLGDGEDKEYCEERLQGSYLKVFVENHGSVHLARPLSI